MAIFQPTSIIPSSFTQGTVDAVKDNMEVSWQVNGNSAMTAFQIDFYLNDTASTPVHSTGRQTENCPFYGTDRFGRPQFFTYNANVTWEDKGFANGNNYKFKITQWYEGMNSVAKCQTAVALTTGNTYYFTALDGAVVYFSVSSNLSAGVNVIYYSYTNGQIWVESGNKIVLCGGSRNTDGTIPNGATQVTGTIGTDSLNELFVSQTSSSDFITRTAPTLTISQTNETYSTSIPFQNYVKLIVANELAVGSVNYFSFATQNSSGQWVTHYATFTVSGSIIPSSVTIYYNTVLNSAYYVNSSNAQTDLGTITVTQTQPTAGNNLGTATLFLATSIEYFHAELTPTDETIRWIRWQVATATYNSETEKWVVGDILADTGDIYTPTLNFEFNGFFNGNQYAIRCFGESESGQSTQLQGANTDGWIFFNISFTQNTYDGNFTAQCLHKENATLLEWEGVTVIPPTVSPEDYKPTLGNGSVTLLPKNGDTEYSVTWGEASGEPMNFEPNWTAVWKGKINSENKAQFLYYLNRNGVSMDNENITSIAFSPDGKLLVVGGSFDGRASIFSVNEYNISYIQDITINNAPLTGVVNQVLFSPLGDILILISNSKGYIFSVKGQDLVYRGTIRRNNVDVVCQRVAFNPTGGTILVGGDFTGGIGVFNVTPTSITFVYEPVVFANFRITAIKFNNQGNMVMVCGESGLSPIIGHCLICGFDNTTVTLSRLVDLKNDSVVFNDTVYDGLFSVDDKLLIVGGAFDGCANVYSVSGTNIEYLFHLTENGAAISFCYSVTFNMTGKYLALGCAGRALLYLVNDEVEYVSTIQKFNNTNYGLIVASVFSPVSDLLVLGEERTTLNNGGASAYSVGNVYYPQGRLFELKNGEADLITLSRQDNPLILKLGHTQLASVTVPDNSTSVATIITPTTLNAYFYDDNGLISQSSTPITYTQQPITSVSIYGGDSGATVDSVSVYDNREKVFDISNYEKPNFEPVWNDTNYQLYMTANFNGNLEGGTGTSSGKGFQIYRQEVGKNVLTPIANVSSTTTSLKDYGISSRKAYKYSLYAYDSNSAFMGGVEADNVIATNFKNYSLLVCDYDYDKDEYHVRKQYLFALNLSSGSVGNNNSPTLNKNFTQYPTRMVDTANYASGTLSGLIGAIYTVPALIEQIGQYKWTAKPSTMDYFDSVDLEKELYDLSTAPYQLFLRDMKGRLRMIATNGAISMTTNIKQKQQSISISFPWVEVGDASDVTIIQTPDDYGWNNDNQVLDVQLDVDVETGELSATYPFPYNGTKFYLTGANKENLTAKTPLGVTPAQFNLSDTATETTDGEVTATVTVNSEVNK